MKRKIFISLLLVLSPLFIFGCKEDTANLQLSKPAYVQAVRTEDKILLFTDKNPCATDYIFYICKDENKKDDLTNYIRLSSTTNNFVDVTNEFTKTTTYYFYVVTKDSTNKYEKSVPSSTNSFFNSMVLDTPKISITDSKVSWDAIKNATSYEIIVNDKSIVTTTQTNFDVAKYSNGALLKNEELVIKIKALAQGYDDSFESNSVSYSDHLKPTTPTISFSNNQLTINKVLNATSYQLTIENISSQTYVIDYFEQSSKTIDLTQFYDKAQNKTINLLQEVGPYTIYAKSLGSDYISNKSNIITTTVTKKINTPTINYATISNNSVEISLTNNSNISTTLCVEITINGSLKKKEITTSSKTFVVTFSQQELGISNINSALNCKVSVFALGSGSYYTESSTTTQNITKN